MADPKLMAVLARALRTCHAHADAASLESPAGIASSFPNPRDLIKDFPSTESAEFARTLLPQKLSATIRPDDDSRCGVNDVLAPIWGSHGRGER
jgi:hypothetical protein